MYRKKNLYFMLFKIVFVWIKYIKKTNELQGLTQISIKCKIRWYTNTKYPIQKKKKMYTGFQLFEYSTNMGKKIRNT